MNNISGVNLYAYCNYNPVMNRDDDGESVLLLTLILAFTMGVGIVAACVAIGIGLYCDYKVKGWIDVNQKRIQIKNSGWIFSPISRAIFLALMYMDDEYKTVLENSGRSYCDYLLEWDLHNLAFIVLSLAYISFNRSPIRTNETINNWSTKQIDRAETVEMEDSKDWFRKMFL